MKKIFLFACATIMMVQFISYSKKDSSTPTQNNPTTPTLVGRWQTIAESADRPVPIGDTIVQDIWSVIPSCIQLYFTFNADNTSHSTQIDCNGDSTLSSFGKWQLNKNTLSITDSGKTSTLTVLKLTADSLQISGPSYSLDKNNDTVWFTATETFRKRQSCEQRRFIGSWPILGLAFF